MTAYQKAWDILEKINGQQMLNVRNILNEF